VSSAAKPPRVTPGPKVTPVRGRKPPNATTPVARPFQPPQAVQASPNLGRKVEQALPQHMVEQPQEGQVLDTDAGNFEPLPAEAAYLAQEQVRTFPGVPVFRICSMLNVLKDTDSDRQQWPGNGGAEYRGLSSGCSV